MVLLSWDIFLLHFFNADHRHLNLVFSDKAASLLYGALFQAEDNTSMKPSKSY
jgi:hypothetical protein